MKKFALLFLAVIFLSGCATYKFQHGKVPFDKGYVALRDNYMIPDYTVGQDNTVPDDLSLAKERFKRRRNMVEYYYKQMGLIENHFKLTVWNHVVLLPKAVIGIFKLPFIAVNDHKYDTDPVYREKVRARDDVEDNKEEEHMAELKAKVAAYVQNDLAKEGAMPVSKVASAKKVVSEETKPEVVQSETKPAVEQVASTPLPEQVETKPVIEKSKTKAKVKQQPAPKPAKQPVVKEKKIKPQKVKTVASGEGVKAIIIARPIKGYSPLKVNFSAANSSSPVGRIVSYTWDFGDGDTSTLRSPVNTYWSVSFEPRKYNAALTVQDDQGNTAQAIVEIEVLNK